MLGWAPVPAFRKEKGDFIKRAGYTDFQCQPKSKRKHRRVHRSKYNVFWYHQRLGFLSYFSPVTLATFTFSVNKDAKESCVYLQIIHKTEHTLAPNFAAEILPRCKLGAAHMPQSMGEPSWYYCFEKLTHQTLKKGTFTKALAYIDRFLRWICLYGKHLLSRKSDDPRMGTTWLCKILK